MPEGSEQQRGATVSERGARLLEQALALSFEERAELADRLSSSLEASSPEQERL